MHKKLLMKYVSLMSDNTEQSALTVDRTYDNSQSLDNFRPILAFDWSNLTLSLYNINGKVSVFTIRKEIYGQISTLNITTVQIPNTCPSQN